MRFRISDLFYVLGYGDTIYLWNDKNKNGGAKINKSTSQDYPEETNLVKKGDNLFIAGGSDESFTAVEFELYGLIF